MNKLNYVFLTFIFGMFFISCVEDNIVFKNTKENTNSTTNSNSNTTGTTTTTDNGDVVIKQIISTGLKHVIILNENQELIGWGSSGNGELGMETEDKINPKKIAEGQWNYVSAGSEFTLYIKNDGTLWASGRNGMGQLGNGTSDGLKEITQIGTDNDWKTVSAGYEHSLAIKNDGTLWAWGQNSMFQLGLTTDAPKLTPTKVGEDTDWEQIATSYNQSFAIKKDGTLWAWGNNGYGQLGTGNIDNVVTPQKIGNDADWSMVSAGTNYTAAIKKDGSLWMWGNNYNGQLGNGKKMKTHDNDALSPIKIGIDTWKSVSCGKSHVVAIKSDNTLWTWGNNMSGELGIGGETGYKINKNTPQQVGADNDWEQASAGQVYTIARKKDGTYYGFGTDKYYHILNEEIVKEPKLIPIK